MPPVRRVRNDMLAAATAFRRCLLSSRAMLLLVIDVAVDIRCVIYDMSRASRQMPPRRRHVIAVCRYQPLFLFTPSCRQMRAAARLSRRRYVLSATYARYD